MLRRRLRESEARFRSLTEMSSDFYWESDLEHRLTMRGSADAKVSAVSVFQRGAQIGERRWELPYLSPDEAGWRAHRADLDAHRPFRDFTLSRRGTDGTERFIVISGDPVFDATGAFKGYRGVGTDITERKQSEAALAKLAAIVESSNDAIISRGLDFEVLSWNAAAERLFGYSAAEAIGQNISALIVPPEREAEVEQLRVRLSLDCAVREFETLRCAKDGRLIDVSLSQSPINDERGVLVGASVIFRDITERKRVEQRLNMTIEISQVTLWEYDLLKDRLIFDRAALATLGLESEDPPDSLQSWIAHIHADDREPFQQRVELAMQPGDPLFDFEYRMSSKASLYQWIHTKGRVIQRDAGGQPMLAVGTSMNITKRKDAEAERARLELQLRESQKMEALGTLAGGVAHDFNNALAAILGNVELARQDVGPGHAALVSLEEIGKASRRAKDLVQQILAFGRRQKIDRKATSLALVVVETARLLRASIPATVSLKVNCEADAPSVLADATQVNQIVLNLCSNALQAVQDAGRSGVIEIRLDAHTQIEPRGNLYPGRFARITVRDNGSGMDEATRSHIFEPFFTTKAKGQGTGLGLSVVHGIVQAHDASVEVQSTPGEGSEFRIYFPAIEGPALVDTMPIAGTTSIRGNGKNVLYVDDEEAIIFLMKRLLERQGFRVSGYTDPREALAAARANPDQFDLAVTDYNMPYLSGLEVAQALKEIRADLPVVLASGYITEELRAQAPAAGVSELIYKPNTVDDLCAAVARFANAQVVGKDPSSPGSPARMWQQELPLR